MYVITGASGNTGKAVAEKLLAAGKTVRAIGRNIAHLQPLVDKGAEAVIGSIDDAGLMTHALAGAEAAYLMIPPNWAEGDDFRGYQNRVAKAYVDALKDVGVPHVVALSSVGADLSDRNGPIAGLHDLENYLNDVAGLNALSLRAAYFMENNLISVQLIKNMGVNGGALRPDLAQGMIATRDIADYAAKRLLACDFHGKLYQDILGPRDITMLEVTKAIGTAIGKPDLPYFQASYEDVEKGMVQMGLPPKVAAMMIEMNRSINDGLIKPSSPRNAESTTPTTIEDFAKMFAAIYAKA